MAMNDSNHSENKTFCDDSTYTPKQVIISGICVPVLICFGLTTNLINSGVFGHAKMRKSPINRYLLCLSLCDLANLFCASFIIPMPIFAEQSASATLHNIASTGIKVAFPIGQTMHTISIYLTVVVSGFRFLAVCFPFESERICTMKTVNRSIIVICVCSVLYNFSRFFELKSGVCTSNYYNADVLELGVTAMRSTESYVTGYLGWSNTIVLLILPFTLLIIMNLRVIYAVRKSRKSHLYSQCGTPNDMNENRINAAKERNTTIMLIGIVAVFIICNFPALVSNIMEIIMKANEINSPMVRSAYAVIVSIGNLMVLVNMGVNFFIYLGFSDRYRNLLKRIFCSGTICRARYARPIDLDG